MPSPELPGIWSCHHVWRCQAKGDARLIFPENWLQRRIELINEPDDSEAPEWAVAKGQDSDGKWNWFSFYDPTDVDEEEWMTDNHPHSKFELACIGKIPAGHDWRTTLTEIKRDTPERQAESSLADDRLKRDAKETGYCRDGMKCGAPNGPSDDAYCPECPNMPEEGAAVSKYHRQIKDGVWVDIYDVLSAWDVRNAALQHLVKKALAPGQRGHKDLMTDLDDIIASSKRAKELES